MATCFGLVLPLGIVVAAGFKGSGIGGNWWAWVHGGWQGCALILLNPSPMTAIHVLMSSCRQTKLHVAVLRMSIHHDAICQSNLLGDATALHKS